MDCPKRNALAGLPDEAMMEILSRVPVKDLRRSKCVSKPWRDLIADPLNRKKLPQTLEGFFHCGAGGRRTYGDFTSLLGSGECVHPVDPSFSFLTAKLPGVEHMVLLDSCSGLLLFGCIREGNFGYIVCNPATEQLMTLPASSASCPPLAYNDDEDYYGVSSSFKKKDYFGVRFARTFLIFDPAVSCHFHLVQIWMNTLLMEVETVHSYSSETRAWTDRSSKWKRGEEGGEWALWGKAIVTSWRGAFVHGLLHFVILLRDQNQTCEELIVAVDGEGKTCRIMDRLPSVQATFICQSQGHLHCIGVNLQSPSQGSHMDCFTFTQLSVWVLQDYDTQDWILKHNVSTSQLFGLLSCPFHGLYIVAIHPDHNLIILVWKQKLVSYNMNSKELRALCNLGKHSLFITPYVPCYMEPSILATKD